jgi:hypothetical protein
VISLATNDTLKNVADGITTLWSHIRWESIFNHKAVYHWQVLGFSQMHLTIWPPFIESSPAS